MQYVETFGPLPEPQQSHSVIDAYPVVLGIEFQCFAVFIQRATQVARFF